MKKRVMAGLGGVMLAFLLTVPFIAEAKTVLGDYLKEKNVDLKVSSGMDFFDKYVWRGFLLDGDASLQPWITLSSHGFSGGFWGSFDTQSHDALSSDEQDGWIGYSHDLGFIDEKLAPLSMNFGHTWYNFSGTSLHSEEFYLGLALDTFLKPSFTWYVDYADENKGGADGEYYKLAIAHSFTLIEDYGVTFDLGEELGFNNGAFIKGTGGYNLMTAGVTIPLTEALTMTPKIGYSVPFSDLASSSDGNQKEQFYGGVSVAFNF